MQNADDDDVWVVSKQHCYGNGRHEWKMKYNPDSAAKHKWQEGEEVQMCLLSHCQGVQQSTWQVLLTTCSTVDGLALICSAAVRCNRQDSYLCLLLQRPFGSCLVFGYFHVYFHRSWSMCHGAPPPHPPAVHTTQNPSAKYLGTFRTFAVPADFNIRCHVKHDWRHAWHQETKQWTSLRHTPNYSTQRNITVVQ